MNLKSLFSCACFASLLSSAPAETVVKILHLQSNAKIIAIWQEAAQKFEKAHPGVKIEFDYLENEAFKAKLPTLLQSKDRPSLFHSWGGGVMYEQVNAGKDKWPLHFYPALLMMRVLGKEGMQAAYEGKNGGFATPSSSRSRKKWRIRN